FPRGRNIVGCRSQGTPDILRQTVARCPRAAPRSSSGWSSSGTIMWQRRCPGLRTYMLLTPTLNIAVVEGCLNAGYYKSQVGELPCLGFCLASAEGEMT
ncbi:hypothetical protein ACJX0J_005676, partial [Zea mays]